MRILSVGEVMIEMSGGQGGAWRMGYAGDTLNTLWYARAGLDPSNDEAAYFTALGDDGFSGKIKDFLTSNGIDTAAIRRIPGKRPGLYMIEQRDGDRHFTYWRETSAARMLGDDHAALENALDGTDCVYCSGITLAILKPEARDRLIAICRKARGEGRTIAFDPNIRPALWEHLGAARETIMAMAGVSSIVLPSFDDEAATFGDREPGETLRRYRAAGADEVAVKDGPRAILFETADEQGSVEAKADVSVVDATGAGDSFNGAYLAARLKGASAREAVEAGRDMAARVVTLRGALGAFEEFSRWTRQR